MPATEDCATQPVERGLDILTRAANEPAAVLRGQRQAVVTRRLDRKNWTPKETDNRPV